MNGCAFFGFVSRIARKGEDFFFLILGWGRVIMCEERIFLILLRWDLRGKGM